jgi:hypothetical protein
MPPDGFIRRIVVGLADSLLSTKIINEKSA